MRAAIDAVCGSRPGKALKREREYFKRNGGRGRMDYARSSWHETCGPLLRSTVGARLSSPIRSWPSETIHEAQEPVTR